MSMKEVNETSGEIWDLYDKDHRLTGKTHKRGEPLEDGEYHLAVLAWIGDLFSNPF